MKTLAPEKRQEIAERETARHEFFKALDTAERAYNKYLHTLNGAILEDEPNLAGRIARCCNDAPEVPSNPELAFFEYRGVGSHQASMLCVACGQSIANHKIRGECKKYRGGKPFEKDAYYCGHGGWD